MNEQEALNPAREQVQQRLQEIAQWLRTDSAEQPAVRAALASLVDEIGQAVESGQVLPEEVEHLAQTTANLTHALHQRSEQSVLERARHGVEEAIVAVEVKAPFLATLTRRTLDTLASLGI